MDLLYRWRLDSANPPVATAVAVAIWTEEASQPYWRMLRQATLGRFLTTQTSFGMTRFLDLSSTDGPSREMAFGTTSIVPTFFKPTQPTQTPAPHVPTETRGAWKPHPAR